MPARAGAEKLDYAATLDTQGVPVVALAGTCMNAGKTAAACAIVSRLRHLGYTVDAFKSTGVALRTGLYLAQAGEFGFVLVTLAADHRLIPARVESPLLAAMVLSMLATPLIVSGAGFPVASSMTT